MARLAVSGAITLAAIVIHLHACPDRSALMTRIAIHGRAAEQLRLRNMIDWLCKRINRRVCPVMAIFTCREPCVAHGCWLEYLGIVASVALPRIGYVGGIFAFRACKEIGAVMTGGTLASDAREGVIHNGPYESREDPVAFIALRCRRYVVCWLGQTLRCPARRMAV